MVCPSLEATGRLDWFPIVMLHRVVDIAPRPNPYNLCISTRDLERVILFLRGAGFRIVHLEEALAAWKRGEPVNRFACLTFDDGYEDFYTHPSPCCSVTLSRRRSSWSARTWAVRTSGTLAALSPFGGSCLSPRSGTCWAKAFALVSTVASHRRLTELSLPERNQEIAGAKRSLEAALGREIGAFAYPFKAADDQIQSEVAAAGYLGACGGEQPAHTPFLLHRVELRRFDPISLSYRLRGWRYVLHTSARARAAAFLSWRLR